MGLNFIQNWSVLKKHAVSRHVAAVSGLLMNTLVYQSQWDVIICDGLDSISGPKRQTSVQCSKPDVTKFNSYNKKFQGLQHMLRGFWDAMKVHVIVGLARCNVHLSSDVQPHACEVLEVHCCLFHQHQVVVPQSLCNKAPYTLTKKILGCWGIQSM